MSAKSSRTWVKDFGGAFADAAILFPLLAALSTSNAGLAGGTLLLTAGLAYWIAGAVFRVPMPVQPLKSIAIAALALGASGTEIRVSGALLGVACLLLLFTRAETWAARVPTVIIHSMQVGLGVLLITQGLKTLPGGSELYFFMLVAAMFAVPYLTQFPLLGWVAAAGLLYGVLRADSPQVGAGGPPPELRDLRPGMIAALVFPQLALTLANSVVGTRQAAQRYFGRGAERVTVPRLLSVIGLGNLVSSLVGGLPFCHGAGGLTAHVRGGATTARMNWIIGGLLVTLAGFHFFVGGTAIRIPPLLVAALLAVTGIFHILLAEESWRQSPWLRIQVIAAAAVSLATHNLLWVLGSSVALTLLLKKRPAHDPVY
ncbi:MAG: molybdate transporter family protein [Bacteriovoracia bacterium]